MKQIQSLAICHGEYTIRPTTMNHVVTGREESNGPSNELPTATRDLTAELTC
jgi:hypothetical protein